MTKNNNVLTKEFNGQEVTFRINNETGVSEVQIDSVARFCGWTRIKNNKEYLMWDRVNGYLSELQFPQKCGKGDFIPEYIMYPLIGKANNKQATNFMLWVGQVLVDLRTKGVVILNHAENAAIDFEKKYGKYRIRKTFTKSNNIIEDYKEFDKLSKAERKAKRLNNKDRVKLCNIIVSALEKRINNSLLELKPSEIIGMQEVISDIKTDITKLSNKKNGGDKTAQTKKIKQLQEQLESIPNYPVDYEFVTLDVHGFSNNYMYKYCDENVYKSEAYKMWIKYFPYDNVPEIDYWEDVDFDKPIELFINYVAKPDIDIRNLDKSFIDMIFNNIYEVDDNIVESIHSQRVGVADTWQEGKISFFIRNK
ncbi:hypothetical protein [Clostridium pasteurianum]|uniref:Bro-N domain-containing protein n=1 Tax=Clostridium pasteurianum BC1 TaxID=86416 RepID=R4KAW3_CLOPA|nr:hypothetical protein [Clostridium pasteurianum]AGK96775.1 hypothetical protein Clopa_1875 [Clostridium pasteurianum BC1]